MISGGQVFLKNSLTIVCVSLYKFVRSAHVSVFIVPSAFLSFRKHTPFVLTTRQPTSHAVPNPNAA
jgi:hypothetical protein